MKTFGEEVVAVLGAGDLDVADEVLLHEEVGPAVARHDGIEAGGEEAGFESGGAEEGLLGESDALDGEEFLGVDGLVGGDEVGLEVGDGLEVFEADDGEVGGPEAVLAGVEGGAGLAFGSAGAGGAGGVGAVGGELLVGNGGVGMRHENCLSIEG
ncbi:MAG TPA: hypothetical protein VLY04_00340 [Bryobacteraceae bacterium]|nr:hypothetical protein [Bryobacteraceae bacterium]